MTIICIAIGDEVLGGETREGNGYALAQRVARFGARLGEVRVIADERRALMDALALAAGPGRLVVTSGGLGPTDDDGTRQAVADALGVALAQDDRLTAELTARYERLGRRWVAVNLRQAFIPAGATPLSNRLGTAPGFVAPFAGGHVACLPGPPREFAGMLDDHLPDLLARAKIATTPVVEHCLRVFGITESALQEKLAALPDYDAVRVRSLPHFPEIRLEIRAAQPTAATVAERFTEAAVAALDWRVFARDRDATLAGVVVGELLARHKQVAFAESCTGGLIGHMLTEVPGVSATLLADLVTYSNAAKRDVLGVPQATLDEHGAVSEATARGRSAQIVAPTLQSGSRSTSY